MNNYKTTKNVSSEKYETGCTTANSWRKMLGLCISLLFLATNIHAQQQTVVGIVKDTNNETIIGASIQVKGTTNGTITDIDGNFSISAAQDATLIISYIGYRTQEVKAITGRPLTVILEEATELLEEVVVVGYGVQKKATLSGSVSSVKGNEIIKAPVMNVSNSLAGRMPGVVAISNSSEPGYDGSTLRIRGVNTFGNSSPLIVVDGVPGRSLDRIDPASVETISVMKDASAAIYGAQAANGVIIITTKRGKAGKPSVKFALNYGLSQPTVIPKMANAAEYGILLNEIDRYAGQKERYTSEDIQKFRDGSDPWSYPNTDWFKETLKPWSPQTNVNATIDGGSDNFNYFFSLSAKGQDGIYRKSATNYDQYDMRINLDWKINNHIDVFVNTTGRMEDRNYPTRSAENIFRMLMRSKPNMPAYWPNGMPGPDIEFGDNPVVIVTDATGYEKDKRYVVNGDLGINIKIPYIEGLSFKGVASLDKTFRFRKVWQTPWYLYAWDGSTLDANGTPLLVEGKKGFSDPRLRENMEDNQSTLLSGLLNYNKTFSQSHTVNAIIGAERILGHGDNFEAYRRYYISPAIDQLFAGGQDEINNTGSAYKEARLNYFGRLNYSYNSKYLAEFVWRYQGSYIFDKSNKFGFFPGVS